MAPLPPNNTDRLFIDYTSGGVAHRIELRLAEEVGVDGAVTMYTTVTGFLVPLMNVGDAFTGARFHAAGANNSFRLPVQLVQGTNIGGYDLADRANFASITGQSTDGRDSKITYFSVYFVEDSNYRDTPAEWPVMQDLLTFVGQASNGVVSISGDPVLWNQYVNIGVNAYYQRQFRRG